MNRRTARTTPRGLRTIAAVLLGAVALVGVSAAPAAAVDPPAVEEVSIDPGSLPGSGGVVDVRAKITAEDGVLGATVVVRLADFNTVSDEMQRESTFSDYWVGSVTVPANSSFSQVTHSVDIATFSVGGNTSDPTVGTIEQAAFDPLPTVSDVRVAPATLPQGGGPVTIRATATDDSGLSTVYAEVRTAGARVQQVDLTGVGGDVFQGTFTAPANTTTAVKRYAVKVVAVDSSGQQASAARAFSVASRAVTMAPAELDFGHLAVGSTRAKATRLTNNTTATVAVSMTIPSAAPYRFADGTKSLTVSIPAGASRAVPVTFAPTARGTRAAKITVSLADQLPLSLSVIGTGING